MSAKPCLKHVTKQSKLNYIAEMQKMLQMKRGCFLLKCSKYYQFSP